MMGVLKRFFTPGQNPADHTDTWRAGDWAECIWQGPWYNVETGAMRSAKVERGERFVVHAVGEFRNPRTGGLVTVLQLIGLPDTYDARAFRKIVPQQDSDQVADAAFLDMIRKPAREFEIQ